MNNSTSHDAFLRVTLSSPQAIQDFFQAHLPTQLRKYIDFSSIQPVLGSQLPEALKELPNILIFTCQIYHHTGFLLLEHASTPALDMPLRLIKYNTAFIEQSIQTQGPGNSWPFIFNACLYHGMFGKPYPYPTSLEDYFSTPLLAQELGMLMKFYMINLSILPDHTLESHGTIGFMEKLFKYKGEQTFFQILGDELDRCRDWILGTSMPAPIWGEAYWQTVLCYVWHILDKLYVTEDQLANLFKDKLFKSKEEVMRVIAQYEGGRS